MTISVLLGEKKFTQVWDTFLHNGKIVRSWQAWSRFTHALSKYDVWRDCEYRATLALSTLLLSRAYAFLAFWSLAKFLQAASLDSRAWRWTIKYTESCQAKTACTTLPLQGDKAGAEETDALTPTFRSKSLTMLRAEILAEGVSGGLLPYPFDKTAREEKDLL